jgi:hypothetical protein
MESYILWKIEGLYQMWGNVSDALIDNYCFDYQ